MKMAWTGIPHQSPAQPRLSVQLDKGLVLIHASDPVHKVTQKHRHTQMLCMRTVHGFAERTNHKAGCEMTSERGRWRAYAHPSEVPIHQCEQLPKVVLTTSTIARSPTKTHPRKTQRGRIVLF